MDQRTQFIADFLRGSLSHTELCELYRVSRKTGYKWIERYVRQTPASLYRPSTRQMPNRIPPFEYPDRFEVRYVSANGGIRWNRDWINVSIVCIGEHVGLEEIDDGIWNVYFGLLKLGRLNERHMRIEDEYGRLTHRNV